MQRVTREQIVDLATYAHVRPEVQERVLRIKQARRVHAGEYLTFLFENPDTIRYQVQEMLRVEGITDEEGILHELHTYNELLGRNGELGCTLLIEIADEDERSELLRQWVRLPVHVYVRLEDGTQVYATYDERQIDDARLSSVQYLKFDTQGRIPVAVGSDLPELMVETTLASEQRAALRRDLGN